MNYQLTYLINPDLKQEAAESAAKKTEKYISDKGGAGQPTALKKIQLAYPIKKKQTAFLASLNFEAEKAQIKEIKQLIDKSKDILRFLIVSKEPFKAMSSKFKKIKPKKKQEKKEIKKPEKKVDIKDIEKELEKVLG